MADALREIDGRRWMMTGDIAVMDEDGYLRICDRSKDMLIVGASPETLREQIIAFCRANMAPYKVPREIHFTPAIPLTSVGKIDKKALRLR